MSVGAALTIINSITLLTEILIDKKDILEVIDYEMEEALAEVEHVKADERQHVGATPKLSLAGYKEGWTQ